MLALALFGALGVEALLEGERFFALGVLDLRIRERLMLLLVLALLRLGAFGVADFLLLRLTDRDLLAFGVALLRFALRLLFLAFGAFGVRALRLVERLFFFEAFGVFDFRLRDRLLLLLVLALLRLGAFGVADFLLLRLTDRD